MVPVQTHLFYGESTELFKVALRPLYDCKKRLLVTTYFDNLQPCYDNFANMLRARMTVLDTKKSLYSPFKERNFGPVTPGDYRCKPLRYWQSFTYESHGVLLAEPQKESAPAEPSLHTSKRSATDIAITIGEVSKALVETSHQSDATVAGWVKALKVVNHPIQQDHELKMPGELLTLIIVLKLKLPLAIFNWDSYIEYGEGSVTAVERMESYPCEGTRAIVGPRSASTALTNKHRVKVASAAHCRQYPKASLGSPSTQEFRGHPHSTNLTVSRTLLDEPTPELKDFPSLFEQSENDPTHPSNTYQSSTPPSLTLADLDTVLIDFSEDEPLKESQQLINEPSTRTFHHTMNQRAPRARKIGNSAHPQLKRARLPLPSPPPSAIRREESKDPHHIFLNQAKSKFKSALAIARAYSGSLEVQASFGRVFISNVAEKLVAREDMENSHFTEFLNNILQQQSITTYPTKILTIVPQDIQHMIDLEENDQRLWDTDPQDCSVAYCFQFGTEYSGESFVIEIQADSLKCQVRSEEKNFGTIYVHGIQRQWDYVFELIGVSKRFDEHSELIEVIKTSLRVP